MHGHPYAASSIGVARPLMPPPAPGRVTPAPESSPQPWEGGGDAGLSR